MAKYQGSTSWHWSNGGYRTACGRLIDVAHRLAVTANKSHVTCQSCVAGISGLTEKSFKTM